MRKSDKREWSWIIFGLLVAFWVCVGVSIANAHHRTYHNKIVAGIPINARTLACDTQERVHTVLVAQMSSFAEARELVSYYHKQTNSRGEPVCMFGEFWGVIPIEKVGTYDFVHQNDGSRTTAYIIKVRYPDDITFFIVSRLDLQLIDGDPA